MGLYPKAISEYLAYVGIPRSKGSKVFVVDAVNGSDSNTGLNWEAPLASIEAAYDLTTTLKNDVVLLVGNGTSNTAAAAITWNKSYVHLVGLCANIPNEQRSRIKCAADLASTPFVTWGGSGCIVRNISFWHETSAAGGLVNVLVTGGRNLFEYCQFAGAVGTNNASGARSLHLKGATASGNVFRNCTLGNDTIQLVSGADIVEFDDGAMHTLFEDCQFTMTAGNANNSFVCAAAAADVGRLNIFKRCLFVNENATTVATTEVIRQGGGAVAESSRIIMMDCKYYGAGTLQNANHSVVTDGLYATAMDGAKAAAGHMIITH